MVTAHGYGCHPAEWRGPAAVAQHYLKPLLACVSNTKSNRVATANACVQAYFSPQETPGALRSRKRRPTTAMEALPSMCVVHSSWHDHAYSKPPTQHLDNRPLAHSGDVMTRGPGSICVRSANPIPMRITAICTLLAANSRCLQDQTAISASPGTLCS